MRTVNVSMVVHRGKGNFSSVPNQPFRGVCHPDGIRREHEGGEPLWEEESGTAEFGEPLVVTFEVGADRQAWCAFYLQPHAHWERVTDVSTVVNGSSHSATNVECLMPAPGESYRPTVEASQYLPGRSDGCEVAFTIVH